MTRDGAASEARVELTEAPERFRRDGGRLWFEGDLEPPARATEMAKAPDEPPRYVADGLAPGRYVVTATAADGSTARDSLVSLRADGEHVSTELRLAAREAAGVLRGHVKGTDGLPLRGFVGAVSDERFGISVGDGGWRAVDEDGSFVLDVPARGQVRVAALVPGRLLAAGPQVSVPTDAAYELDLSRAMTAIRVHVTDEATGKAVSGAVAGVVAGRNSSSYALERTDAEGNCTLWADMAAKDAGPTLYVRAAGYPDADNLELLPDERQVDVPLRAGPSLRVRVVRADDGSPVAGAPVFVRDYDTGGVSGDSPPLPTGTDGVALVTGLRPGEVFVFVSGNGWFSEGLELGRVAGESYMVNNRRPQRAADMLPASGTAEIELRAIPSRAIEGVVRRHDGTAVAGAFVEARAVTMLPHLGEVGSDGFDAFPVKPVVSDADGKFRVEGLFPPARFALTATARGEAGNASIEADATQTAPAELRFARPHTIEVDVRDASTGRPVKDASVCIRPPRERDEMFLRLDEIYGTSGADGIAHVGPAVAGAYEAFVSAKGYRPAAAQPLRLADEVSPDPHLTFRLEPGAALRGRVVLADGAAIDDASVGVQDEDASQNEAGSLRRSVRGAMGQLPFAVGADGTFEITGLVAGEHTVNAVATSGGRSYRGSARGATGGAAVEIRLEPDPERTGEDLERDLGAQFTVRVIGPDGRPVGRASVSAQWSDGVMTQGTSFRVVRGRVLLPVAVRGFRVTVSGASSLTGIPLDAAATAVEIPRDAPDGHEIRLAPGLTLAGTVADEAGRPVAGIRVSVREPREPDDPFAGHAHDAFASTVTGADGVFELRRMGEDEVEVVCETPPDFEAPAVVRTRAGRRDLALRVVRGTRPVVTVLDDRGDPVAGAQITVGNTGFGFGDELTAAETGPDGRVVLAAIPGGRTYRLSVSSYGDGLKPWSEEWTPQAQTVVRLKRLATLSGRAWVSDDEPAAGVVIWYSEPPGEDEDRSWRRWGHTRADADGRFTIRGLSTPTLSIVAGNYASQAMGFRGMETALVDPELVASDAQTVTVGETEVQLRLVPARIVRVRLEKLTGPLGKDHLPKLNSTDHRETLDSTATEDPSVVLFSGVSPSREYELLVREPRLSLVGRLAGVRAGKDATISLEPGTALSGRLVPPDGTKMRSGTVEFTGGGFEVRVETGPDGRFLVPCLPRVEGNVRAWSYDVGVGLGGEATATPGTEVEVRLVSTR